MITLHNPDTVVAPASFYSQATEVGPGKRWLHISGQVGAAPDRHAGGRLRGPERSGLAQHRGPARRRRHGDGEPGDRAGAAGGPRPLSAAYREIRDRHLGGHQAASTLLIVAGLADERWLIEIEALAAAET